MADLILPDALAGRLFDGVSPRRPWTEAIEEGREGEARVELVYVDAARNRTGRPVLLSPELAFTEAFRSDGSIGLVESIMPGRLPSPPEDATIAQLFRNGELLWEGQAEDLERRTNPMPSVAPKIVGPSNAKLKFPIFSERFVDEQTFHDHVGDLREFIVGIPPFDTLRDEFALLAYYWKATDPARGWFNTLDVPNACVPGNTQVMHGDRELARSRLVHLMLDGKFGLVLIDSKVRGGAGGLEDWQFPAWATVTPCKDSAGNPIERWEAIALHEIGHALGLCDEYLWDARAHEEPRGEPNVTRRADAASAGWALPVNRPGNPTSADPHPLEDRGAVGTYRGCRYRTDLYRSAPHCLMRETTTPYFCDVCAHHVAVKLG